MKAQDLKKQLLNVVGPVDFSKTPLDVLQKFANTEMDKNLRKYFFKLQNVAKTNYPDVDGLIELREAENDILSNLIQMDFNDETTPFFKRYLTVVCLFPECVMNMTLLLNIINYYNISNKKI